MRVSYPFVFITVLLVRQSQGAPIDVLGAVQNTVTTIPLVDNLLEGIPLTKRADNLLGIEKNGLIAGLKKTLESVTSTLGSVLKRDSASSHDDGYDNQDSNNDSYASAPQSRPASASVHQGAGSLIGSLPAVNSLSLSSSLPLQEGLSTGLSAVKGLSSATSLPTLPNLQKTATLPAVRAPAVSSLTNLQNLGGAGSLPLVGSLSSVGSLPNLEKLQGGASLPAVGNSALGSLSNLQTNPTLLSSLPGIHGLSNFAALPNVGPLTGGSTQGLTGVQSSVSHLLGAAGGAGSALGTGNALGGLL